MVVFVSCILREMHKLGSLQLILSRKAMKSMWLTLPSKYLLLLFVTDVGYVFMEVVFGCLISDRICLVVIQMSGLSLIVIEGVVNDGIYFLGRTLHYFRGDEC